MKKLITSWCDHYFQKMDEDTALGNLETALNFFIFPLLGIASIFLLKYIPIWLSMFLIYKLALFLIVLATIRFGKKKTRSSTFELCTIPIVIQASEIMLLGFLFRKIKPLKRKSWAMH